MSGTDGGDAGSERITGLTRDGLTFDVLDEGPLGGDVVVLLHGFPERATCWRLVAPLLHAQGYRTLAPDQRGYSPRARPRGRRAYRLAELVDDVAALIELAGGRVHLVGHDWGAAVAWGVAMAHPERVRTLTALSVPHPGAYLSALAGPQLLRSWYMVMFNLPRVAELSAARRGGPMDRGLRRSGMSADDVDRFRREIVDDGALPGGLGWYRGMPFAGGQRPSTPITVPTTMVWSDGDGFISRTGVERCERYVTAPYELVVLPGVSHWIPTQAPQAAAAAILDRLASA